MTETESTLKITDSDGVRTITLNRPDVLNAFNDAMLGALGKALNDASKDPTVRCVVITGAGRAFGSGQDLAEVKQRYTSDEPIELGAHLRAYYNRFITKIRTMDKPVIAAVNGVAAGAGASLALACDLRIAGDSASFIQSFIHVGLIPDAGGSFMLPRLVGIARAMEIASTGRKVEAKEALDIGMVNQVVPDEELPAVTMKLAKKLAGLPTKAIGLTKRAINHAWSAGLEQHLDYEAMLQTSAGQTEDHREGVTAFIEKRKPEFKGN